MYGLMQDSPLLISSLISYADLYHGDVELVSRTVEGPIHRYGYQRRRQALQTGGQGPPGLGSETR